MYQAYWGLSGSPFRGNLDPLSFYQAATQDEALARLHFLVDERRSLGLLLGGPGCGKSILLEVFARQLGQVARQKAILSLLGVDAQEFMWLLAGQLGVEAPSRSTAFALSRHVTDHITANRYQQLSTILLLDDADEACNDVLDQIVRLAQFDVSLDGRLTIVLAAQPRQSYRLGSRLLELADLRIDLDGWDSDDTAAFVKRALSGAGRSTPIFSEAALRRIHEHSGGIPRRVKQLADLALLAGAGQSLVQIEADTIDAVFHELGVISIENPLDAAAVR